jgi:cytochrome c551/c552
MNRSTLSLLLLAALCFVLAGCGSKSSDTQASSDASSSTAAAPAAAPAAHDTTAPAAPAATAPVAATLLAKSLYDDGPRANATPVDAAKATAGEQLFKTKGCVACHTYGKKMLGPDLKGVTARRTAAWMEHQIMQPDVMTKTDPISHQLMGENKNLQMLNLHLTQPQAEQLVEYFKKLDKGH